MNNSSLCKDRFFPALTLVIAALALVFSLRDGHTGDSSALAPMAHAVDFSSVVEAFMPSLVKIENQALAGHPALTGINKAAEVPQVSEGSGFFVDKSGLVLTNYHVVDGAYVLRVVTYRHKSYDAEVVGADAFTDLALIRIKPDFDVTPAKLGDSDKLKVGNAVLALGNPLGLDFLATAGIVSGFGPPGPNYIGFYKFIQVDLSIKPGNSGGPLVNSAGEVVGINYAYMGPGTNLGFAIPINRAKEVMESLRRGKPISRGFLGMLGQPMTAGLAERLGLPDVKGSLVSAILKNGPGYTGGLKEGDVVIGFNGAPVVDDRDLNEKIFTTPANTKVTLKVARDGQRLELPVTLGEIKEHGTMSQKVARQCGLTLQELTDELAASLGMAQYGGLLVLKVVPGCPAYEGGLRFGDIIKKVEGKDVNTASDFYALYSKMKPGSQVLVTVVRENRPMYLTIKQGEGP